MVKNHLKRLNAPKTWPIDRKKTIWVSRPNPGAHAISRCIPLSVAMREVLKHAKTLHEAQYITNKNPIFVDQKERKEIRFGVGLMDTLSIPMIKENYRVSIDKKGKLAFVAIDDKESHLKISKITSKSVVKGKVNLGTHDGRTFPVAKDEYKTGDSLLVELPGQKIKEHLKLEKNATVFLIGGKYVGTTGTVEDLKEKKILIKTADKHTFETAKEYAFVVGKDKPLIMLHQK